MQETIDAFPLQWPIGFKRNTPSQRIRSPFKQGMDTSQKFLRRQLELLGAGGLIVSTNIPVRKDGGLFADYMSKKLEDPGVAIYFRLGTKDEGYTSMCCDQYNTVWENIYALGKSIEAIRGLERWGSSEFMQRVFTGFKALPFQSTAKNWWDILEVSRHADQDAIRDAYRKKLKQAHPDVGGTDAEFIRVQQAYQQALSNG